MNNYKKYIFTGIMSIIPITITYWIIEKLFIFFSKPGKLIIDQIYKIEIFKNYNFINNFYQYLAYLSGFILTIGILLSIFSINM